MTITGGRPCQTPVARCRRRRRGAVDHLEWPFFSNHRPRASSRMSWTEYGCMPLSCRSREARLRAAASSVRTRAPTGTRPTPVKGDGADTWACGEHGLRSGGASISSVFCLDGVRRASGGLGGAAGFPVADEILRQVRIDVLDGGESFNQCPAFCHSVLSYAVAVFVGLTCEAGLALLFGLACGLLGLGQQLAEELLDLPRSFARLGAELPDHDALPRGVGIHLP